MEFKKDVDVKNKIERLILWCEDVNEAQDDYVYAPVYIKQEEWSKNKDNLKTFQDVINLFVMKKD